MVYYPVAPRQTVKHHYNINGETSCKRMTSETMEFTVIWNRVTCKQCLTKRPARRNGA